ncbi:hypothetical protein TNCT_641931 [Trichonephila clavata]|uniref:Uncharacterized protein n=1 Tax=Trichonephila clavata TaxID=2740835 RepID=A0A8X6HY37_TRICU|nr:hypothetical protein TNCT_641931 [Trichonephila clavata]
MIKRGKEGVDLLFEEDRPFVESDGNPRSIDGTKDVTSFCPPPSPRGHAPRGPTSGKRKSLFWTKDAVKGTEGLDPPRDVFIGAIFR